MGRSWRITHGVPNLSRSWVKRGTQRIHALRSLSLSTMSERYTLRIGWNRAAGTSLAIRTASPIIILACSNLFFASGEDWLEWAFPCASSSSGFCRPDFLVKLERYGAVPAVAELGIHFHRFYLLQSHAD